MPDIPGLWAVTDHVCRQCWGRILTRNAMFMCSNCERTASLRPTSICGCGIKNQKVGLPTIMKNAYVCGVNPDVTPLSPTRICILFDGVPVDREHLENVAGKPHR